MIVGHKPAWLARKDLESVLEQARPAILASAVTNSHYEQLIFLREKIKEHVRVVLCSQADKHGLLHLLAACSSACQESDRCLLLCICMHPRMPPLACQLAAAIRPRAAAAPGKFKSGADALRIIEGQCAVQPA